MMMTFRFVSEKPLCKLLQLLLSSRCHDPFNHVFKLSKE